MRTISTNNGVVRSPSTLLRLAASTTAIGLMVAGCMQTRGQAVTTQERVPIAPTSLDVSKDATADQDRTNADVQALVNLGPRVAGTPVMEQASTYLMEEYRKAGYVAEVQSFTYQKFEDRGSRLTVSGKPMQGRALRGTPAGNLTSRLVVVPNVGRSTDVDTVNLKGAIAIVRRGGIPFSAKAENATKAGAIGLVIVNNESGMFAGTLSSESTIPVLGLSGQQGNPLLERAQQESLQVNLTVNAGQRQVTGRNVVAHLEGVTQPKVLLGGHYDSVPGSPGANDNASGTAVVLAIARQLSKTPLARETWFVAFDGEEDGLHGSRAFVKSASPQFLKGLKGMFNFDMVGINSKLGVGGTASLTRLVQADTPTISTFGSNSGSDHASFAAARVPVLFFYRGQEPNYHSPNDRQVDVKLLNETTQVALNIINRLLVSNSATVNFSIPNQLHPALVPKS